MQKTSLLNHYFKQGWLLRRYFDGKNYGCPYSAEDRLTAGELFYADYLVWNNLTSNSLDLTKPKVDGGKISDGLKICLESERFRQALRLVSRANLPVIYKIVLEEKEIKPPKKMTAREKLYFNDEIKGLLVRGLDELCRYYSRM